MARIDVSEVLTDPDLVDEITLVRRVGAMDDNGRHVVTETASTIYAVVQDGPTPEEIQLLPESARLLDMIRVYYAGLLTAEQAGVPGGYGDVLVWKGRRYMVTVIPGGWTNWGAGYTKALAVLEQPNGN